MDATDLHATARKHFQEAKDAWGENHDEMLDDLRFLSGEQWPQDILSARESDGRPCITINKLPSFVDQYVGNQLQNRPQIKFLPVDDNADPDTAEVMTGIFRHVEQQSDADVAYDTGAESAASCGLGAWRVITEYADEDSFDQEIRIERIINRFSVLPDPLAKKWDYSDGRYFFLTEEMSRESFETAHPDASRYDWEENVASDDWHSPDTVRVAEYFYKETKKRKIHEIFYDDGMGGRVDVVEDLPPKEPPYEVLRSREFSSDELWWCKMNGAEILEGPTKMAGRLFPIVLLWGKELVLEKKRIYRGIIRFAKDPTRLYNYSRSMQAETTALAPKAPVYLTPKQVAGHEGQWNTSMIKNWPYILFNPDPQNPGIPRRDLPPQVSTAIHSEIMIADQEIHDTTGLQLASLGKVSNEKSGKAIMARRVEGDIANYAYSNNLARAMKYTAKIVLELIPVIYDTPRMIRILGEDGAEKIIKVNQQYMDPMGKPKMHNLSAGKYDVVASPGPSYTTRREESVASMLDFLKVYPQAAPATADLVVKALDWPGKDEFQKRLEKMVPPGIKEPTQEEMQAEQNQPPPPPDPVMEMRIAQEKAKLEIDQIKVQQEQMKLEGIKVDNDTKIAELTMMAHGPRPSAPVAQ
jgi:hypothetical protein